MIKHNLHNLLKNKAIKIAGFLLAGIFAIIVIILTAASIYVHNNKAKITSLVKQTLAKHINGGLQIGDVDIAVWTHFPNISIELENVTVTDSLYHLPMLKATKISCSISLFQLATPNPDIERVKVSGGVMHLFVDSTGFDNAYLLASKKKDSSAAEPSPSRKTNVIHRIEINDFQFISEEARNNKRFDIVVHSASATVERKDSILHIVFEEDCLINGLGFNLEKGEYLENTTVKARWQLRFDKGNKTLEVAKSRAEINNTPFSISAMFNFNKPGRFELHAAADKILYKDARAILTKKIQRTLGFVDVLEPINVNASLIGSLTSGGDPQVSVTIIAANNTLKTPQATFDACNFIGTYKNQVNVQQKPSDPNSTVYFDHFTGKWAGLELIGDSIHIDDLNTPLLFFKFHSQCSFQQLNTALNLHTLSFDEGLANLQLHYKGPLVVDYSMFADITGGLQIQNGKITYVPHNLRFENCNGNIAFSKNSIVIKKITCNFKTNKFTVTGSGNSITNAMMDKGKTGVECNIFCPSLNAADFKAVFAKDGETETVKSKSNGVTIADMDDILVKGDLKLNILAKQLLLGNFTGQNAKVLLLLRQNDWQMQEAYLDFGGGSLLMDAGLHRNGDDFLANAHLIITNADVQKTFYAFDNFGQHGITYDNIHGSLNARGLLQMQIDNTGGIVPGTMQGGVSFSINNGALINFKPLLSIQEYALKNRDLNNVSFAEIKDSLTIQQNEVLIPRMEISSTAMRIFVDGVYGINNDATDISIQVPLSNLSKPITGETPGNKGVDAKVGPSIYLRAKPRADGKIKLGLDLFKKFRRTKDAN
jgi:hypothetical protein